MVFFVCGACGDSFKRKQAEQHTFRCKNWCFSCMDCNKDFEGKSFAAHTQCITESEKNFGSYHVAKAGKDKNEVWMEKIRRNLSNRTDLKPFNKRIVDRLVSSQSIPRKEAKFVNFLKTSMNLHNLQIVNDIWKIVQKAAEDDESIPNKENKMSEIKNDKLNDHSTAEEKSTVNGSMESNGTELNEKTKKRKKKTIDLAEIEDKSSSDGEQEEVKLSKSQKKKKRKLQSSSTDEPDSNAMVKQFMAEEDNTAMATVEIETITVQKKFKWRRTMKDILKEGPADGIKLTKLLNKIEQIHNHPLTGVQYKLDKEILREVMMKNLSKKPFNIQNNMAKLGKFESK